MGGPELAIEGSMGLRDLFGPFELSPFPNEGGDFAILRADMKYYVTEFHSVAPISLALSLARDIDAGAIAAITIDTYAFAYREIGSGPEKWRPQNRETADHSMPYAVAAALHDGAFSASIFAPEPFTDLAILTIADKITIRDCDAFNAEMRARPDEKFPCRVEITLRDGTRRSASLDYPRGHHLDPMSDTEVEAKFRELASPRLGAERAERALAALWRFDKAAGAEEIFDCVEMETGRG